VYTGLTLCPHCGNYIPARSKILIEEENIIEKYIELRKKLDNYQEIDAEMRNMELKKNIKLSQIQSIKATLNKIKIRMSEFHDKIESLSDESLLGNLKSIMTDTEQEKTMLREKISQDFGRIQQLQQKFDEDKQEFLNFIASSEKLQAKHLEKQEIEQELRILVDQIIYTSETISTGSDSKELDNVLKEISSHQFCVDQLHLIGGEISQITDFLVRMRSEISDEMDTDSVIRQMTEFLVSMEDLSKSIDYSIQSSDLRKVEDIDHLVLFIKSLADATRSTMLREFSVKSFLKLMISDLKKISLWIKNDIERLNLQLTQLTDKRLDLEESVYLIRKSLVDEMINASNSTSSHLS